MPAFAASPRRKTLATPGVLAVLTGADFVADGLKAIPHKPWSPHPAETRLHIAAACRHSKRRIIRLPADKARFVGEAVAMVIGETLHAAKDGAERLVIDYEVLPAVVETAAAARQDAPRIHDDTRSGAHSQCLLRRRDRRRGGDRRRLSPAPRM